MQSKVASALGLTFKTTYHVSIGGTFGYAQSGVKSAFVAGATTYYTDGSTDTVCDDTSGTPVCTGTTRPLTGVLSLVRPANMYAAIGDLARSPDPVKPTTKSGLGECLAYTLQSEAVKYCVNSQGILSYIDTPYGIFRLTAFTTTVADSDVSVPGG